MRPSVAKVEVELSDETVVAVIRSSEFLEDRPPVCATRLATGTMRRSFSWGGCPCETRSDSDAANRSLALSVAVAHGGRTNIRSLEKVKERGPKVKLRRTGPSNP